MAQSICNMSNIIPVLKSPPSSKNTKYDYFHSNVKSYKLGLTRPICSGNGVRPMKAVKRDNLDQFQFQTPGLKKREFPSAPIGLWDRFPSARTMQQMMDTMDRLADDPSALSTRWTTTPPSQNDRISYARGRTPWDIKEVDDSYKLRFDMPGMTRDDVRIYVEDSMLVIKAEKAARKNNEGEGVADDDEGDWPAKSYGNYSTRIALPENVEFEKIKAEVRDGVLYLTVPKPNLKSKVFDINVE